MTDLLDATEPTDQRMVSELPYYIRQNRSSLNSFFNLSDVGCSAISIAAGVTNLTIGTEFDSSGIEVLIVTGTGIATLSEILDGTEGQILILIFQDSNIRLQDSNSKANGTFYLNQLPANQILYPQQDDVLALCNIGGDGTVDGYWKEVWRQLSVK